MGRPLNPGWEIGLPFGREVVGIINLTYLGGASGETIVPEQFKGAMRCEVFSRDRSCSRETKLKRVAIIDFVAVYGTGGRLIISALLYASFRAAFSPIAEHCAPDSGYRGVSDLRYQLHNFLFNFNYIDIVSATLSYAITLRTRYQRGKPSQRSGRSARRAFWVFGCDY
jgi:hypothetical protein